ncbi:YIP1 family protein [Oceanomicrobium pacificus]|uniref:YIP1 family protein n=1 Tax=Oceanomicrobium pacificus TaxID=2692916 RepID=A0A6B0TXK0_9RHOB|nr:YIP1 family protein [Oceanomicrobium pacificus]MXU65864.1 YIP1 family protein [Oceanomicrobium pacificus]
MAERKSGSPGLVADILNAYRGFRPAMRRQMQGGFGEERALFFLMLACALLFVASLPGLRGTADLAAEADDPLAAALSGRIFGFFFFLPLILYGVAALSHLLARVFGGQGNFFSARLALFWGLVVAMPVVLVTSAFAALFAYRPELAALASPILGTISLAVLLWSWAAALAEAEGFASTARVATVICATVVAIPAVFVALF